MKYFSQLITDLEITNKTNDKIDALVRYFSTAPDQDKLWVIALFTGKRPKRPIKSSLMRDWCLEIIQLPEWLYVESYSTVGDLGETLALLLPPPVKQIEKTLSQWMAELESLRSMDEIEQKAYVLDAWSGLETQERMLLNKLIGGSFRLGVSKKTLVNALSKFADIDPNQMMHSISGKWSVHDMDFNSLINGEHINYDLSKPYPFCLAYALDGTVEKLGEPEDWQVEYKWDGIRGQLVKRNGELFIWSRGEELVTDQFPEITQFMKQIDLDFVMDGELLAMKNNAAMLFNDLQKRLNRKNVTPKLMSEVPVGFCAYDLLELDRLDLRSESMADRRLKLEELLSSTELPENIKISEIINFENWDELPEIRSKARAINSEGLMLKSKNSIYHAGRKKGHWWKWKVDPLTIDAVMIYAQKGSGRRSGYYTDFTFAIKKDDALVTIAKAYSGLTNEEIVEINKFIRKNVLEKFGPVRTVKPELVFEIAFEGIALSNRHKSGIALRFPRISRWRKDKTVEDIDTIETVRQLLHVDVPLT